MLLAKYSEPMLKGESARRRMVRMLRANIAGALKACGAECVKIRSEGGLFLITAKSEQGLISPLLHVFGVDSVSVCDETEPDLGKARAKCAEVSGAFATGSTFAIRAKRSEGFPIPSPQVGAECGEAVLDAHPSKRLKVDLGSPQNEIFVDMRKNAALVCGRPFPGPGGLPAGAEGTAACIVSSEFSSLAAWMMAKRGMAPVLLSRAGSQHAEEAAKRLAPWFAGTKPGSIFCEGEKSICENAIASGASAIVSGELWEDARKRLSAFSECSLPLFMPLIGLGRKQALSLAVKAGLAEKGAGV